MITFFDLCVAGKEDIYEVPLYMSAGERGLSREECAYVISQRNRRFLVRSSMIVCDILDARRKKVTPHRVDNVYCLHCTKVSRCIVTMRAPVGSKVAAVHYCCECLADVQGSPVKIYGLSLRSPANSYVAFDYVGPVLYFDEEGGNLGAHPYQSFTAEVNYDITTMTKGIYLTDERKND